MNCQFSLKDFMLGMLAGLFFSLIALGHTVYCQVHLSFAREFVGVSIIMLSFGIAAGIFGIEKLMDSISGI